MSSQRQSFRGAAWRRLLVEQRGAVAAIMGLAIIPLFAVVGLAIDTGRGYMLKSKLSYAIDAAGLAGGRAFDTDHRREDIMMFFEANFPTALHELRAAARSPDHHLQRRAEHHHDRGFGDHSDVFHEGRRRARGDRFGAYRHPARAARHGAGAGDGQHRLDARQRRHGRDEAGGDRSDQHPVRRPGDGAAVLGRRGALRRVGQHRHPARELADRLQRR